MLTFIQAIARMEGFNANSDNIPTRHKNPGDICAGQFANAHGAIPGAVDPNYPFNGPSRYAVFPDVETGWNALRTLLRVHYLGMTIKDAISKYAPATENDTAMYIANICAWTKMQASDVLTIENIG